MHLLEETPGRTALVNDREYLFFSGYNYLGMHRVPQFVALVKEGMDKYGWLFPSSRISNTTIDVFEKAEHLLCAITGMEATVIVASGYLAGRIATAPFRHNLINLEPSHPAITRHVNGDNTVFATDSVQPLTVAITDFSFVYTGADNKIVIADDSHGIGLIGENGAGIAGRLPKNDQTTFILPYSLSKAFHISAGAISCNKIMAAQYRQHHGYTSATPPSPALLHAFIHGQELYSLQRCRLQKNIAYFNSLIGPASGIRFHTELPVYILPDTIDEQKLAASGIIISSFAYPDAGGKKINRIVLNALHTNDDLDKLAECLYKSGKRVKHG